MSSAVGNPKLQINPEAGEDGSRPAQLLIRQQHDTRVWTGKLREEKIRLDQNGDSGIPSLDDGVVTYSRDGRRFLVVGKDQVTVFDSETRELFRKLDGDPDVRKAEFSPLGTHVLIWQEPGLGDNPNVFLWRLEDGELVLKTRRKEDRGCSTIQWSEDETWAAQILTNTVTVFQNNDFSKPVKRLRVEGITNMAVSPGQRPFYLATFVPVRKGQAAQTNIYHLVNPEKPVVSKIFFKAERAELRWSPDGRALAVLTSTDKAEEGSYYGESGLHLLLVDGSLNVTVPFGGAKGPVLDVQFSPDGKEFVAIQGFQPTQSYLFQTRTCKPIFLFGNAARNTVVWSPHGRFLCLAGFGNLPGEMEFWDRNKLSVMGSCNDRDGAKSFEWTPCGRFFITAALWPFRRVDNSFHVWTYYGELVEKQSFERLYQVGIRPALPGVYPDLPQSPRILKLKKEGKLPSGGAGGQQKKTGGAYVPPHLRGKKGAERRQDSVQAARNIRGPQRLDHADKVLFVDETGVQPEVRGKLSRSQKRRLRQKAKAAEEAKIQEALEAERRSNPQAAAAAAAAPQHGAADGATLEKQIRRAKKKLGQIEKLLEKEKSGTALSQAEKVKVSKEQEFRTEIEELEKQLAQL